MHLAYLRAANCSLVGCGVNVWQDMCIIWSSYILSQQSVVCPLRFRSFSHSQRKWEVVYIFNLLLCNFFVCWILMDLLFVVPIEGNIVWYCIIAILIYFDKAALIHCQHVVLATHLVGAINCSRMFGTCENAWVPTGSPHYLHVCRHRCCA